MTDETCPPVVYADDALLAIDKPAGLLAVPGKLEPDDCASVRVRRRYADALVVHRLDQPTSGLMLFARGAAVQRALSAAFERRAIDKRYVAIVAGCIDVDAGTIDLPLCADWPNRPRQIVDRGERGKPSSTRFRVLERHERTTRVELQPLTGRSHQLRVHLAAVGHAIVGDALYAPPEVAAAPRLMLHAAALRLAHPRTTRPLELRSDPPF